MALIVSEEKCSNIKIGDYVYESIETSSSLIICGPPERFCKIDISLLIFAYLTGLRILITIF